MQTGTDDLRHLGPGYYGAPPTFERTKPSRTPFGSSGDRKFITPDHRATGATVGPGTYKLPGAIETKASPTRPKYASPWAKPRSEVRARVEPDRSPGPGRYAPRDEWASVDRVMLRRAQEEEAQRDNVNWVRVPTAPSIPTRAQSYGYEEGDTGELVQQVPKDKGFSGKADDLPGPGHYQPKFIEKHSHAVTFGKGAPRDTIVPRTRASLDDPPSPSLQQEYHRRVRHLPPAPPRPSAAFVAKKTVPRVASGGAIGGIGVGAEGGQRPRPGPGEYTMPSSLNIAKKRPKELQFFGSTSRRFADPPGSAAARLQSTATYSLASDFDMKRKPQSRHPGLVSKTQRFMDPADAADTPVGPGQYTVPTFVDEMKRQMTRTGSASHFGSTAKRFQKFSSFETPGPGGSASAPDLHGSLIAKGSFDHHTPSRASKAKSSGGTRKGVLGKDFGRASNKPVNPQPKIVLKPNNTPPPGAYDTSIKWKKSQGVMRFNSGGQRFPDPRQETDVGPGEYKMPACIQLQKGKKTKVMVSSGQRSTLGVPSEGPGPGSYDTQLAYGNMLRPTFNIAIAEQSADIRW